MPMVHVGNVRVRVRQGCMLVRVRVGLAHWPVMLVDMMLVVNMSVLVLDGLVRVSVLVLGSQEHDDAGGHGCHREELARTETLPEQSRRNERTDERSGREVGSLPRGAEQAKRAHREHHAQ